MSMSELDLGRLLKSFCDKNGVPLGKEVNLLKLLADVGGVAEDLFSKNSKVNASIKAITGEDSMMVCPNCGSHVIIEYKTCIACGEELFEGAGQTVKPQAKVSEEKVDAEVTYPTVAEVNKMKKPELEQWVNLIGLDVDMDGKLKDIRDAIKAELKELKNPTPVKASEEVVEEEDTLDDLEEDADLDEEFDEEEDEEELDEEFEEEEFEEEESEELEDDDDLDEEFEEEEELEDGEEELDEEFEEEEELEDGEEEEELEDDDDLDEEFEEEEELEDGEFDDEEELLDDEELEEELDEEFEEEEELEEEPAPKKTTKKKVAKKVTKKVAKKAPAKKVLSDKKADREAKRLALKKKIPSLIKNPALIKKLEHSERVSLQTMLGEEQGNKKTLAELKGDNMIAQLKKQLVIWKRENAKK